MNSIHLTSEELTAAAVGERDAKIERHLEICADCWQHMANYRESLVNLRQDVSLGASRSAIEWGRQSRSIMQRIAEKQGPATYSRGAILALATSAVALAVISFTPFIYRSTPTVSQSAGQVEISDAVLLQDVEARLEEDLPDALQPANLLVTEMGGIDASPKDLHSQSRMRNAQ